MRELNIKNTYKRNMFHEFIINDSEEMRSNQSRSEFYTTQKVKEDGPALSAVDKYGIAQNLFSHLKLLNFYSLPNISCEYGAGKQMQSSRGSKQHE